MPQVSHLCKACEILVCQKVLSELGFKNKKQTNKLGKAFQMKEKTTGDKVPHVIPHNYLWNFEARINTGLFLNKSKSYFE